MVRYIIPLCLVFLAACGGPAAQQPAAQTVIVEGAPSAMAEAPSATTEPTTTMEPSLTAVPTKTEGPTATVEPTTTVAPSSTPEPTATVAPSSTAEPTATTASLIGGAMAKPTVATAVPTAVPVQPLPTTAPAPVAPTATVAQVTSDGQRFRAVATPDGVVAVREDPNTMSPIVRSLIAGADVICTGITKGETLEYNGQRSNDWYFCPNAGGFIFELLLEPAGAPEAAQPSAPTSPPVVQYVDNDYRVVLTPDGFVAVRAQPNTTSATVRTLTAGTIIHCTQIVKGELLTYNELTTNQWLSCPSVGGYVFAALLVTTVDTPAVVEPYIIP